jgi:uncharacterized protein (DUF302 family)
MQLRNRVSGRVLRPEDPLVAIDFPLMALACEDEAGKVWLTYQAGGYLAQRHGVKGMEEAFKRLTSVTGQFAKAAAQ